MRRYVPSKTWSFPHITEFNPNMLGDPVTRRIIEENDLIYNSSILSQGFKLSGGFMIER